MRLLILSLALLTACANTPQGQSIDRSNTVDLGTTVAALVSGGVEGNPTAPYTIPLKWLMGRWVDTLPCEQRVSITKGVNPVFYGASANNLAVAFGLAHPIAYGVVGGIAYWVGRERVEPEAVFSCKKSDPPLLK